MQKIQFTKNHFGISIKMCCASCAYKEQSILVSKRRCTKHGRKVRTCNLCARWKMDEKSKTVGKSRGRVKCKEYIDFYRKVRKDEENCFHCVPLTIEEIREMFETVTGISIYVNI